VHVHHQAEVVERHLGEGLVAQHARVVDEDVDAAPFADGARHHRLHLREIGHVAAVGDGQAAGTHDLVGDRAPRRAFGCARHVVHHHARAMAASASAWALPRPLPAPVTMATRPSKNFFIVPPD
jgi:hypothetical protein